MAFPVVEEVIENSTNTAGTNHTINLPTATSGNLLLIILDKGSTSATVNSHASLTELLDEASANGLYIAYRWMDGTEPASYTLVTSAATRTASMAYRISGAANPATQAPQIGTTGTGTSATPDPPASAAPGATKDFLFIAFAGMAGEEADDDTWGNTPPTNYTPSPPRQKSCGTVGSNLGGLILAAERQLNTGSAEDPGTFGVDVSAAWRSQTITVWPGAGNFTETTTEATGAATATDTSTGTFLHSVTESTGNATATDASTGTFLHTRTEDTGAATSTETGGLDLQGARTEDTGAATSTETNLGTLVGAVTESTGAAGATDSSIWNGKETRTEATGNATATETNLWNGTETRTEATGAAGESSVSILSAFGSDSASATASATDSSLWNGTETRTEAGTADAAQDGTVTGGAGNYTETRTEATGAAGETSTGLLDAWNSRTESTGAADAAQTGLLDALNSRTESTGAASSTETAGALLLGVIQEIATAMEAGIVTGSFLQALTEQVGATVAQVLLSDLLFPQEGYIVERRVGAGVIVPMERSWTTARLSSEWIVDWGPVE